MTSARLTIAPAAGHLVGEGQIAWPGLVQETRPCPTMMQNSG